MTEGNFSTEEKEEEEREIIDLGEIFQKKISQSDGIFSETLILNAKGKINWETIDGNLASKFAHLAISNQDLQPDIGFEPVFKLAKKVSDKFPNLQFNFEQNPEGQSMQYTVIDTQQVAK